MIIERLVAQKQQEARIEMASLAMIEAKLAPISETLDVIKTLFATKASTILIPGKFILDVVVKDMNEILPFLKLFEDKLGVQFNQSKDATDSGWRSFSSAELPCFRVDASITDDPDAACRRVVVGQKTEPIYEIVCDGQGGLL